jgi:hypothetical protein
MNIRSLNVPTTGASMHRCLIATFLVLSLTVGLRCDDEDRIGSIEGIVTYEDGAPVRGATAYASPADRPFSGVVPHADTDESGIS